MALRWTFAFLIVFVGCQSPTEPRFRFAEGWWTSASGIVLQVHGDTIDIIGPGCWSGSFPTPRSGGDGFTVSGLYGLPGFGPPPPTGFPASTAAFYGELAGAQLRLKIFTAGGEPHGPWLFDFDGSAPRRPVPLRCSPQP